MKRLLVSGFELGSTSVEGDEEPVLTYETRETPVMLEDDALLLNLRSERRPLTADSDYRARVDAQFAIVKDEPRLLMLDSFMRDLLTQAREWLDTLYGGAHHLAQMTASRNSVGPNAVYGYVDEDGVPRIIELPMGRQAPTS